MIALIPVASLAVIGNYRVKTDSLAPRLNRGDYAIVLKNDVLDVQLQPGDIIACKRDGEIILRKVTRIHKDQAWIIRDNSDEDPLPTIIPRRAVLGKVIRTIKQDSANDH